MVSCRCLQKTYPSQLPSLSVILIFVNEALSIIQRAITSVINRTPSRLLKEIILVDDFSSNGEQLDQGILVKMTTIDCAWLERRFSLVFGTLWAPHKGKRKGSFTECLRVLGTLTFTQSDRTIVLLTQMKNEDGTHILPKLPGESGWR